MYMSTPLLSLDTSEEGIRSHYRWLWATMWLLGIELRTSGRAVGALNRRAIQPQKFFFFKEYTIYTNSLFRLKSPIKDYRVIFKFSFIYWVYIWSTHTCA
jgi:hypothetical protein